MTKFSSNGGVENFRLQYCKSKPLCYLRKNPSEALYIFAICVTVHFDFLQMCKTVKTFLYDNQSKIYSNLYFVTFLTFSCVSKKVLLFYFGMFIID